MLKGPTPMVPLQEHLWLLHRGNQGYNHLPRGRQILKALVMPLPEAGVVVGAGVVVEVEVGAQDGGEAEVHKEIQTQIQNLHLQ